MSLHHYTNPCPPAPPLPLNTPPPTQTKTQQIRLLESEKGEVQRELNQLRASINDGTTEVQRLIARDRRVQEEIVRELQVCFFLSFFVCFLVGVHGC